MPVTKTKEKKKPGRPKVTKPSPSGESLLLKKVQKTNVLLNEIKFILDNMWRERRPE